MKEFAIPAWQYIPASIFGVGLFLMNFVILFTGETGFGFWSWTGVVIVTSFYLFFIGLATFSKSIPMKPINEKDIDWDQIDVSFEH